MSVWDKRLNSAKPCLVTDAHFRWTCFFLKELQVFFNKKLSLRLKDVGVCVVCVYGWSFKQYEIGDLIWQAARRGRTGYGDVS